ncbi:MAG: hypothetical protein JO270_08300 [Acidobacteriaceae bacterium]|nr:hypothetical protein [Acidobacteriaceae bacterium]
MQIRTIVLRGLNQTEQDFGNMLSDLNTWGMPLGLNLATLNISSFDCYDAIGAVAAMNAVPPDQYLFGWGISFGGGSYVEATGGTPLSGNHPFPLISRPLDGLLLIDPVYKGNSGRKWTPGVFTSGAKVKQTISVWRNPGDAEPEWSSPCETAASPTVNYVQKGEHVRGQWNATYSWPAILRVSKGGQLIEQPPPTKNYAVFNTHAATIDAIDYGSYNVVAVSLTNGVWYQINSAGQVWTLPGANATQVSDPNAVAAIKANAQPAL